MKSIIIIKLQGTRQSFFNIGKLSFNYIRPIILTLSVLLIPTVPPSLNANEQFGVSKAANILLRLRHRPDLKDSYSGSPL